VNWGHLGQPEFDRRVETLLVRMYRDRPGLRAEAINGSGGDGGLDVAVYDDQDNVVEVYQLKYYPEGFSGGHGRSRKPKIKDSFVRAMKFSPRRWVLVTPVNLKTPERKWLKALKGDYHVDIDWMGQAALDEALAKYDDLVGYFTRDPLVETLRVIGQESAAMTQPNDYAERLTDISKVADRRSAFWGEDVTIVNGQVTRILRAKDPRAAELDPVNIRFQPDFSKADPRLGDDFADLLKFGGLDKVVLPPGVVRRFEVTGPEWIAHQSEDVTLEIYSIGDTSLAGKPLEVRFVRDDGSTAASFVGALVDRRAGSAGATFRATFAGGLELVARVPLNAGDTGSVTIHTHFAGHQASEVQQALKLCDALTDGWDLQLWFNGIGPVRLAQPKTQGSPTWDLSEILEVRELADDLAVIERKLGVALAVPDELFNRDRLDIRVARLLLEGRCVLLPGTETYSGELTGKQLDVIREMAEKPHAFRAQTPEHQVELLGHKLNLGPLLSYSADVAIDDADELLAAIEQGTAVGRRVVIRPRDHGLFRAVLLNYWTDPNRPIVPEPWNLRGAPEHASLEAQRGTDGPA